MDHQPHQIAKGCSSSSSSGSGSGSMVYNGGRVLQVEDDDEMMMMSGGGGAGAEDLRRGPWTVEEDFTLINYIAHHGEGRWNSLARCAGLKRTGKSCRLRWLNYLRPDVRRGNITLEEQLLILELHSRWGNRWSKIAQHLPGRTDNEIKNYWRTRVQKHAKQLKCDVNSKQFKDTMRYLWMPRLVERIQAEAAAAASSSATNTATATNANTLNQINYHKITNNSVEMEDVMLMNMPPQPNNQTYAPAASFTPENSSNGAASSDSFGTQFSPVSDLTDCYNYPVNQANNSTPPQDYYQPNHLPHGGDSAATLTSPTAYLFNQAYDMQIMEPNSSCSSNNNNTNAWMMMMMDGGDVSDNLWNVDDSWFLQQQQLMNNNYI